MILVRPVRLAGEYSRSVVLPRGWFLQVGEPKKAKILVRRKRLVIYPIDPKEKEAAHGEERG